MLMSEAEFVQVVVIRISAQIWDKEAAQRVSSATFQGCQGGQSTGEEVVIVPSNPAGNSLGQAFPGGTGIDINNVDNIVSRCCTLPRNILLPIKEVREGLHAVGPAERLPSPWH